MKKLIEWAMAKMFPVYELGWMDEPQGVVAEYTEAENCYLDQAEVIRAMR